MDIGAMFTDSFSYAQETLTGKWTRWAIFVLFALPFSLIQFVFDPKKFSAGAKPDFSAIPWGQIAILVGLGFILSFFLSGYIVRIYRGAKPAPDFTGWASLFIDGVSLAIVWLLWVLPLIAVIIAEAAIGIATYASTHPTGPNLTLIVLLCIFIVVDIALLVIIMLLGIIGAIRFARKGSIAEGIRVSEILTTIRTMGWLPYVVAIVGYVVVAIVFAIISMICSFIPYVGWVILLIVTPVFTVFTARYFTLVYDQGEPQQVPQAPVA